MREKNIIKNTKKLNTINTLINDFQNLGLKKGMTVLVHSSLSSIGWVNGGEYAVIQSLKEVLTSEGTIIMPSHSAELSNPKDWGNPPVPKEWHNEIIRTMPAFNLNGTPTFQMGKIANNFLLHKDVKRSNHPVYSFAAWGKNSNYITENHSLNHGMGENTPLGKIYNLDGYILLLGVDYENNSSMHLGEEKSNIHKISIKESPIIENDKRVWKTYQEYDYDEDLFNAIGSEFEKHSVTLLKERVGNASAKLMKQRELVNFTENHLNSTQLK